jgi:NTE family protein
VLSGGNALGAYQAGAYQALQEHGIEPDWVAAASAGAINGAIICGNPPDRRLMQLEEFWRPASADAEKPAGFWSSMAEEARRTAAANLTLVTGWPGAFSPRRLFGPFWEPYGNSEPSSLYDTTPLSTTLNRLIDFDLLNRGQPRFSATAVDLESGADVVFDTERDTITSEHLRASSALLPAFPPVEVEGRLLADAGMSVNLPLDVVLSQPPAGRLLCIALDLLPLQGPRPTTLGDAVCRMQDLMFATQSRRAAAAWQAIFDERVAGRAAGSGAELPSITVLQLAYADQGDEVSGKAFDFSPASARARWAAGYRDLSSALAQLDGGAIETGRPGLTVYKPDRSAPGERPIMRVWRESLGPVSG